MKQIIKSIFQNPLKRLNTNIKTQFAQELRMTKSDHYDPNDIFIVGFPKCGNTWMQTVIANIIYGIDSRNVPIKLIQDLVPAVEPLYYRRYTTPTYFKSHRLPDSKYRRVINIVRDGRDAMMSYYHYRRSLGGNPDWDNLIRYGTDYGLWHIHVEEWLKNPYHADVILIKYEDLLAEPLTELTRLCTFLELDISKSALEMVVRNTSFANLRKSEEKFGMGHDDFSKKHRFFRKGISGSFHELPDDLVTRLNEQMGSTLEKLGYNV